MADVERPSLEGDRRKANQTHEVGSKACPGVEIVNSTRSDSLFLNGDPLSGVVDEILRVALPSVVHNKLAILECVDL